MGLRRREFLKAGFYTGAVVVFRSLGSPPEVEVEQMLGPPALDVNRLARFVDPLTTPPIARPLDFRPSSRDSEHHVPYYKIEMKEFLTKVHRELPPTRMWGYDGI